MTHKSQASNLHPIFGDEGRQVGIFETLYDGKGLSCPICKGSGWDTRTYPKQVCDCVFDELEADEK